ncbi:MFS transporter [Glycomyces harbinensis]|nr:MFS transporter [Glycomyces harbinensis]
MRGAAPPSPVPPVDRAGSAAWIGLGVLSIPIFMTAVDMSVLFLAMPTIAAELLPSGTQQLWVLHIGDIAGASLVLTAGRLVDRFGPRRLLLVGLLAYGAASTLAAASPSIEVLILARMLLGAATVTLAPAAVALLRRMFPSDRRFSVAVALLMAAFSGGMALGPPLGGLVLEHFWWGAIFLLNVPIALGVACAWRLLPGAGGTGQGRIDGASIGLSALGIAGFVYGGQELAAHGWSPWRGLAVAAGVVLIAAFLRRQRTLAEPLLDLALFRSASFSTALLCLWLVITASAGADLQFAQHLQVVSGHSQLTAGAWLVVPALVSVAATAASPVLLRRLRPGHAIGLGALTAAVGAVGVLFVVPAGPEASTAALVGASCVVAIGMAPVFAIGTNVVLASAPASQTGTAQGMQDVSGSLGNTAGLAMGGTVAYLSYSGAVRDSLPTGLDAATAGQSAESIGGALAAAEALPPDLAGQVADAAAAAFAIATRDTYIVAAVGFTLLAAVAFWGLRRARLDEGDRPRDEGAEGPAEPGPRLLDRAASDLRCTQN